MNIDRKLSWHKIDSLISKGYTCGHCGTDLSSEHGWYASDGNRTVAYIYICHKCTQPTYFFIPTGTQVPGPAYGSRVQDVSDESVQSLYEEARRCTATNSYTASVLCCRKLLMNIAVSKGAPEGKPFVDYVNYLADHGYVPPDGKEWVDHIRVKGNEANHEIRIMSKEDAEELLSFAEMLLKFIFEFPAKMKKKTDAES